MNIYSPTTGALLHIIYRKSDANSGREDIVPAGQFLQVAALRLEKDTTFKPHRHIWKSGKRKVIAQECWVVISGNVKVTYYDLDNTVLHEDVLVPGDLTVTLQGGHNYMIQGENSYVIEIKTGPYTGVENDKEFI